MRLSIPHDLVLRPVTELGLSVAISNALLFNNVRVLGELDGFDEERLLRLRNLGPTKVAQLLRTIQALVDIFTNHGDGPPSEKSEDNALARAVESDGRAAVPAGALAVPPHLTTCRTESLCTWPIITTKLLFHGLATLERLNRIPKSSLQSLGLSQAAVSELERAIAELGAIPQSSINLLAQARQDGTILVPALAPQTLCALANADSLESEILGLVNSLNDRDAALALGRWGFRSWPVPTLEDLGAEFKITRERVRQVLERFESRLKSSGLRLRLGSRVPEVLDSAGGVLAIEDLRRRLAAAGLHASLPALRALSRVAALGIAP